MKLKEENIYSYSKENINSLLNHYFSIDFGDIEWIYQLENINLSQLEFVASRVSSHQDFLKNKVGLSGRTVSNYIKYGIGVVFPNLKSGLASISRNRITMELRELFAENLINSKNEFIEQEIWMLTIGASFQRAYVYEEGVKSEAIEKKSFKNRLHSHLKNLVEKSYNEQVEKDEHIQNIWSVSECSKNDSEILTNGKLNFGVSQKMLNLYLKYQWCLGNIPTPPHFPVDRIIQEKLGLSAIAWTQMDGYQGEEDYLSVIEAAKEQLAENKCKNVAELELKLFRRS